MSGLRFICRRGTEIRVRDQFDIDFLTVPKSDVEAQLADGWFLTPEDAYADQPSMLEAPAAVIIPQLATLDEKALTALLADEESGKARKGVIVAISAALDRVAA